MTHCTVSNYSAAVICYLASVIRNLTTMVMLPALAVSVIYKFLHGCIIIRPIQVPIIMKQINFSRNNTFASVILPYNIFIERLNKITPEPFSYRIGKDVPVNKTVSNLKGSMRHIFKIYSISMEGG